jgi:hypothetical protein
MFFVGAVALVVTSYQNHLGEQGAASTVYGARAGSNISKPSNEFGSLTISPPEGAKIVPAAIAKQDFRFRCTYTAGSKGAPPGTSLEVIPFNHSHVKFLNPKMHLMLKTISNPKRTDIVVDPSYHAALAGEHGAPGRFIIRLKDGLDNGEQVVFQYAIPRPWAAARPLSGLCSARFIARLRAPNGTLLKSFETPTWEFQDLPPVEMFLLLPSTTAPGERIPLLIGFVGKWGLPTNYDCGLIKLELPAGVTAEETEIRISPEDTGHAMVMIKAPESGVFRLRASSDNGLSATSNPVRVRDQGQDLILWGDMHKHSLYSWDSRNTGGFCCLWPKDLARLGRQLALLDFLAITDHGQHECVSLPQKTLNWRTPHCDMVKEDWDKYCRDVLSIQEPGIIVFLGYEHRDPRGDTIVMFRNEGSYFIEDGKRLSIEEVWDLCPSGSVLTIPHFHPQKGTDKFTKSSPNERLLEIYSIHGRFESYKNKEPAITHRDFSTSHRRKDAPYAQDLLDLGLRLGISASGDHAHPGMWGVTAVRTKEKSRSAIFESLLNRRVYATTGARILIDMDCGGLSMGQETTVDPDDPQFAERKMKISIHAPDTLGLVEIIRNGRVLYSEKADSKDFTTEYYDTEPLDSISLKRKFGKERSTYYYLRVTQKDGHMAWTSPMFLLLEDRRAH